MTTSLSLAQSGLRRSHLAACAREPGWEFCSTCGGEDPDCFDCDGQGGWQVDEIVSDDEPDRREWAEPAVRKISAGSAEAGGRRGFPDAGMGMES